MHKYYLPREACIIHKNLFVELSSTDTLDLNISPYMKAPQQQKYNPYPTLSKNSSPSSPSLASTFALGASAENDLGGEREPIRKKKNNKRRKINKSRRRKIKRRPNQKKVTIKKVQLYIS